MSFYSGLEVGFPRLVKATVLPSVVMLLLWLTSINHILLEQFILCWGLLVIPWFSYLNWKRNQTEELPVFALLAFMYWLYYVPALYWTNITEVGSRFSARSRYIAPGTVTATLALALAGVIVLRLGMKMGLGRKLLPARLPYLPPNPARWNYLRLLMVLSLVAQTLGVSPYLLGEGGRQILIIFFSLFPSLAFAILFRNYLQGRSSRLDKGLLMGFALQSVLSGLASGWLGEALGVMVIAGSIYIMERRKVPQKTLLVIVALALFFQVGKEQFRLTYWTDGAQGGTLERVTTWVNFSLDVWQDVVLTGNNEKFVSALNPTISRVSLLGQAVNVLEQTPSVVPYQYGTLYSYMLITFIPRAVWPDKPSVNDANRFYQVAYGLTDEANLDGVSIAVGVLIEGYISFGWLGGLGVMFLLGIFFDFYQETFLNKESGVLMVGLGVALLPQFIVIEAQMAQYLGGFVQQIFLLLLLALPIWKMRRVRAESSSLPTGSSRPQPA